VDAKALKWVLKQILVTIRSEKLLRADLLVHIQTGQIGEFWNYLCVKLMILLYFLGAPVNLTSKKGGIRCFQSTPPISALCRIQRKTIMILVF
jgi:hypothetical protein